MKTGNHLDFEDYINTHSLSDQTFDMTGEFYTLHNFDLDSYDRRFAIIDSRSDNLGLLHNDYFEKDYNKRIELLKSQNFVFIRANPWESVSTMQNTRAYPDVPVEHCLWTGDTTWFWWYMWRKHKDNLHNFEHGSKKYEFLYLNKTEKAHRSLLYELISDNVKERSLVSYWPSNKKLQPPYEDITPYPARGLDQDMVPRQYEDTKYSLLSEATDANTEIFMTERLWKSMIAEHVFIVHGNYLYLQKLREMGFRTFNKYFDESYDLEANSRVRAEKIADTCESLLGKNWQDIYLNSKALRKHNKAHFLNKEKLSEQINKQILIFLEFADRS